MLYNVEKCTLNIYRSRVIYFVTLVATLDLKISSRGKNAKTIFVSIPPSSIPQINCASNTENWLSELSAEALFCWF